jgi:hypothetical protein
MRPLAVDLVLLRSTAPDLPLVVGRVLAARVIERRGRHGIINLAGAYLTAELPDELEPGDTLRLVVQEAHGEQVVLALAERRDGDEGDRRDRGRDRDRPDDDGEGRRGGVDVYG